MKESTSSSGLDLPAESMTLTNYLRNPYKIPFAVRHGCSGDVSWVACEHFSVNVGKKQISDYIRTWNLPSCWIHSLEFLGSVEDPDRTLYHYQACFSTPSPRTPILGTASVYFSLDATRSKDRSRPVDTHFVIESNRLVHKPGCGAFREKWLLDIIENKLFLRRQYQP